MRNAHSDVASSGPGDQPGQQPAAYTFGLSPKELIEQLSRELEGARRSINAADSLSAVAGLALRHENCGSNCAVADVLEDHVFPALSGAHNALVSAEEIIERLQQLADTEVSHG